MKERCKQAAGRLWKDICAYKMIGIVLIIYYLLVEFIFSAFCPLVIVTGFPCPGCGITRACLFVITGQFARAWNMNPFIYGWILLAVYVGVQRYLLGRKAKGWQGLLAVLAVAMIVFYFYRMYRYFPNKPPMSYTRGNLFEKILPGYDRLIRKLIY